VDVLRTLAASRRADAVEYLVRARFDDAFAALRGDPGFRAAVRLDQPPATFYERLVGFGGVWEQAGTSCDSPGVTLTLRPERTFRLKVTSVCSGDRYEDVFKGTWTARDPALTLALPTKGRDDELIACGLERDGDEDLLRCALGDDLQFAVRPTRR
jgi:hypothetical protein